MAKKARTPKDLFMKKIRFLTKAEKSMGKEVVSLQDKLLNSILSDLLSKLDLDPDGLIKSTVKNIHLTTQVDEIFKVFNNRFQKDLLADFANILLKVPEISTPYYVAIGIDPNKVNRVVESMTYLENYIGIRKGKVISGSYIDRLGKADVLTGQIKDFVLNSITTNQSLKDHTSGLKQLIVGDDKTPGALDRYYKQYAYDTFSQVDAITQKHFADDLGLKYFIYEGSLIETSRRFCKKRAGKVYSTDEVDDWKNDPDLIDKKTKNSYQPLIERGRYNCRHWIRYISEELAFRMRPELKEDEEKD